MWFLRAVAVAATALIGPAVIAGHATAVPMIDIESSINGLDADNAVPADVPNIPVGNTATFTYTVENTGTTAINIVNYDLTIYDDGGTAIDPFDDFIPVFDDTSDAMSDNILSPGEIWIYEASRTALLGLITHTAFVEVVGLSLTDSDPSSYLGVGSAAVPEPSALALFGLGLAGLLLTRGRMTQSAAIRSSAPLHRHPSSIETLGRRPRRILSFGKAMMTLSSALNCQ